jgi:hypothetical protein
MMQRLISGFYIGRKLIAVVILLLSALFVFFGCQNSNKLKNYTGVVYDEIDGKQLNLEDCFGKKATIVLNYCTWDPVSLQQLQGIVEINKKYGNSGLGIIVFIYDDTDTMRIKHLKKSQQCDFPVFLADSRAVEIFGDDEIVPGILVIDDKLTIQRKIKGFISVDSLSAVLKNYLKIAEF